MEKLTFYRQAVRKILVSHSSGQKNNLDSEVECQIVFDAEHDHYQVLDIGWEDMSRIYSCFIHIDIKNDKIWIQRNMTEADLGEELVEMGIPKEDIVLGLHPAYKRPYTGYGVI